MTNLERIKLLNKIKTAVTNCSTMSDHDINDSVLLIDDYINELSSPIQYSEDQIDTEFLYKELDEELEDFDFNEYVSLEEAA